MSNRRTLGGPNVTGPYLLSFRNDSGELIPPFAAMRITGRGYDDEQPDGTITRVQLFLVDKPNADSMDGILFNGPMPIQVGHNGTAANYAPCPAAYDSGDADPVVDEIIGTVTDSWYLASGKNGFLVKQDGSNGVCIVVPSPKSFAAGITSINDYSTASQTIGVGRAATLDISDTPLPWTSKIYYKPGWVVSRSGVTYRCILAHVNQTPPNATYWVVNTGDGMTLVELPVDAVIEIAVAAVENGFFDAFIESRNVTTHSFTDEQQCWGIDLQGATTLGAGNRYPAIYLGEETGGYYYVAITSTTGDPLTDTSKWIKVVGSITPSAWSGATAYVIGNLVTSGGNTYLCILGHTNQIPPNATYWLAVTLSDQGTYSITTTYTVGQYVQENRPIFAFQSTSGLGVNALLDGVNHTDTLAGTVVLGDLIYGNATPKWQRLAGQITTTRKFLRQTGSGAVSAAPAWDTLVAGDIAGLIPLTEDTDGSDTSITTDDVWQATSLSLSLAAGTYLLLADVCAEGQGEDAGGMAVSSYGQVFCRLYNSTDAAAVAGTERLVFTTFKQHIFDDGGTERYATGYSGGEATMCKSLTLAGTKTIRVEVKRVRSAGDFSWTTCLYLGTKSLFTTVTVP